MQCHASDASPEDLGHGSLSAQLEKECIRLVVKDHNGRIGEISVPRQLPLSHGIAGNSKQQLLQLCNPETDIYLYDSKLQQLQQHKSAAELGLADRALVHLLPHKVLYRQYHQRTPPVLAGAGAGSSNEERAATAASWCHEATAKASQPYQACSNGTAPVWGECGSNTSHGCPQAPEPSFMTLTWQMWATDSCHLSGLSCPPAPEPVAFPHDETTPLSVSLRVFAAWMGSCLDTDTGPAVALAQLSKDEPAADANSSHGRDHSRSAAAAQQAMPDGEEDGSQAASRSSAGDLQLDHVEVGVLPPAEHDAECHIYGVNDPVAAAAVAVGKRSAAPLQLMWLSRAVLPSSSPAELGMCDRAAICLLNLDHCAHCLLTRGSLYGDKGMTQEALRALQPSAKGGAEPPAASETLDLEQQHGTPAGQADPPAAGSSAAALCCPPLSSPLLHPLHMAAANGHAGVLQQLLLHGCGDPNGLDHLGLPPMWYAVEFSNEACLDALLSFGASASDWQICQALAPAAAEADPAYPAAAAGQQARGTSAQEAPMPTPTMPVQALARMQPRAQAAGEACSKCGSMSCGAAAAAALASEEEQAEGGASGTGQQVACSYPALCHALELGDARIVRCLMRHGACPYIPDEAGETAYHMAIKNGDVASLVVMLELDSVFAEIQEIQARAYRRLLAASSRVERNESVGCSCSQCNYRVEVRKLPSEERADIKAQLRLVALPAAMELAPRGRAIPLMAELLRHGALIDAHDAEGRTALHIAQRLGDTEAVRWLLQQGADPMERDITGYQALHLLAFYGCDGLPQADAGASSSISSHATAASTSSVGGGSGGNVAPGSSGSGSGASAAAAAEAAAAAASSKSGAAGGTGAGASGSVMATVLAIGRMLVEVGGAPLHTKTTMFVYEKDVKAEEEKIQAAVAATLSAVAAGQGASAASSGAGPSAPSGRRGGRGRVAVAAAVARRRDPMTSVTVWGGHTPAELALRCGQPLLLAYLLYQGARFDLNTASYRFSLEKALSAGHVACVRILLAHIRGARPAPPPGAAEPLAPPPSAARAPPVEVRMRLRVQGSGASGPRVTVRLQVLQQPLLHEESGGVAARGPAQHGGRGARSAQALHQLQQIQQLVDRAAGGCPAGGTPAKKAGPTAVAAAAGAALPTATAGMTAPPAPNAAPEHSASNPHGGTKALAPAGIDALLVEGGAQEQSGGVENPSDVCSEGEGGQLVAAVSSRAAARKSRREQRRQRKKAAAAAALAERTAVMAATAAEGTAAAQPSTSQGGALGDGRSALEPPGAARSCAGVVGSLSRCSSASIAGAIASPSQLSTAAGGDRVHPHGADHNTTMVAAAVTSPSAPIPQMELAGLGLGSGTGPDDVIGLLHESSSASFAGTAWCSDGALAAALGLPLEEDDGSEAEGEWQLVTHGRRGGHAGVHGGSDSAGVAGTASATGSEQQMGAKRKKRRGGQKARARAAEQLAARLATQANVPSGASAVIERPAAPAMDDASAWPSLAQSAAACCAAAHGAAARHGPGHANGAVAAGAAAAEQAAASCEVTPCSLEARARSMAAASPRPGPAAAPGELLAAFLAASLPAAAALPGGVETAATDHSIDIAANGAGAGVHNPMSASQPLQIPVPRACQQQQQVAGGADASQAGSAAARRISLSSSPSSYLEVPRSVLYGKATVGRKATPVKQPAAAAPAQPGSSPASQPAAAAIVQGRAAGAALQPVAAAVAQQRPGRQGATAAAASKVAAGGSGHVADGAAGISSTSLTPSERSAGGDMWLSRPPAAASRLNPAADVFVPSSSCSTSAAASPMPARGRTSSGGGSGPAGTSGAAATGPPPKRGPTTPRPSSGAAGPGHAGKPASGRPPPISPVLPPPTPGSGLASPANERPFATPRADHGPMGPVGMPPGGSPWPPASPPFMPGLMPRSSPPPGHLALSPMSPAMHCGGMGMGHGPYGPPDPHWSPWSTPQPHHHPSHHHHHVPPYNMRHGPPGRHLCEPDGFCLGPLPPPPGGPGGSPLPFGPMCRAPPPGGPQYWPQFGPAPFGGLQGDPWAQPPYHRQHDMPGVPLSPGPIHASPVTQVASWQAVQPIQVVSSPAKRLPDEQALYLAMALQQPRSPNTSYAAKAGATPGHSCFGPSGTPRTSFGSASLLSDASSPRVALVPASPRNGGAVGSRLAVGRMLHKPPGSPAAGSYADGRGGLAPVGGARALVGALHEERPTTLTQLPVSPHVTGARYDPLAAPLPSMLRHPHGLFCGQQLISPLNQRLWDLDPLQQLQATACSLDSAIPEAFGMAPYAFAPSSL